MLLSGIITNIILLYYMDLKTKYKITPRYKVLSITIYVFAYMFLGYFFKFRINEIEIYSISIHIFINILIISSIVDILYREITDILNLIIFINSMIILILRNDMRWINVASFFFYGSIFLFVAIISNGAIGGADIKLASIIGLLFNFKQAYVVLLCGFILASVFGIIKYMYDYLYKKVKDKDSIAMYPFFAISIVLIGMSKF